MEKILVGLLVFFAVLAAAMAIDYLIVLALFWAIGVFWAGFTYTTTHVWAGVLILMIAGMTLRTSVSVKK